MSEATPSPLRLYDACRLCPRACGADRTHGRTGVCGQTAELRIASAGPHFGEEPCFTGTCGSGAIFFAGCACHCFFCQNWQISTGRTTGRTSGRPYGADAFHALARDLIARGVHNLNFVTPGHFWPHIQILCRRLRDEGETLPFLWNSSGYESAGLVARQADTVDIFLPDFKFADPDLARAVMGDDRYPDLALDALRAMVAAKGFLSPFDPTGAETARTGVLVRHLLLPGHLDNTLRVLRLLREEFGRYLPLSLMSQYLPVPATAARPPFDRAPSPDEYRAAVDGALELGFENLFVQPLSDTRDFLPDFTQSSPFPGNAARTQPKPTGAP
jgi:putative pyruvate formate lyase activating enzyme